MLVVGAGPTGPMLANQLARRGVRALIVDRHAAQVSCSFGTARHRHAVIIGDAGMITTTFLNDTSAALPPRIELRRGMGYDATRETIVTAEANGFRAEADAFADLVRHGWSRWPGATPEESADRVRILEALARSAREGGAVDIVP